MIKKILLIIWYERFTSPLRVIRKSYARYKRGGVITFKQGINRDYFSLVEKIYDKTWIYNQWIKKNERTILKTQKLDFSPLVSVIVPVYDTTSPYVMEMIDSIVSQTYKNWELIIACKESEEKTKIFLREYIKTYNNIQMIFFNEISMSEVSNSALELASGYYIAFLEQNDKLAPNALYEIIKMLNKSRNLKLIYSDQDRLDKNGNRLDPHFKSGWNPDMLFATSYISHLVCIKKDIVDRIGGFRKEYEDAQGYDLLLRALEYIEDSEVSRIEKILYHSRECEDRTSVEGDKVHKAGLKVLQDYFSKKDTRINVEDGLLPRTYKVNYPIPSPEPLVSLLIPTRDGYELLHKCIESILEKTTYPNYEIIILDNQTTCKKTLNYFETVKYDTNMTVLSYNYPFNYSSINNFGVKYANGSIIGLINNDIEVINDEWLTEMVSHAMREEIGAVGAKLYYDDDTIQHAGVVLGLGGGAGHSHKYFERDESGYYNRLKIIQNYAAVTAACLVVRKNVFEEVGGLNEEHLTVAFNDVDFCLKVLKKGYRNLWTPYAELYHYESKSRGAEDTPIKKERARKEVEFLRKEHLQLIENDPFYNKNLTRKYDNFGIKIDE